MAEQAQEQPGHTVLQVEHNAISPAARQMPFGNGENWFEIVWPGEGLEEDRRGYACDDKFAQMTHDWWASGWHGTSSRESNESHKNRLKDLKMDTILRDTVERSDTDERRDTDEINYTDMEKIRSW
jgi:hypothetical protein